MTEQAGRLVVLDRDGVINEAPDTYVLSARDWIPIEGSPDAIAALGRNGFTVCVATNQSCVGRGLVSRDDIDLIHQKMCERIERAGGRIDKIWLCPHRPERNCDCRKPRGGMLLEIAEYYGVPLAGIPVVGDAATDLEAAASVGARGILVLTGKGQDTLTAMGQNAEPEVYADLGEVAAMLIDEAGN